MKGQAVSIDFLAAMTIFIFMIAAGFYIVQTSVVPQPGFTQQVEAAADTALTNFRDETDWTVYRTAVPVRSPAPLDNEPVTVDTPFPGGIVANSTLVMDGNREVRSQHNLSSNETLVVADLRNGTTRLDLVYTRTGTMADRNYSTDLTRSGDNVWHNDLNVTFTTNGLSQLEFDGTGLLESNADLAGGAEPAYDDDLLRVNVTYSSGRKHVRVYEDSGKIRVREFFSGEREWELNLSSSFDTVYSSAENGIVNIDQGGTGLYTATTDWVDFNDSTNGLSIIGDDMFVNVSRDGANAEVDVRVNVSDNGGRKDLVLYAHKGNHTNASAQKAAVIQGYDTPVGVPEPVDGVSEENAADFASNDYESVKDTLELSGLEYNISVDGVFKK
ncbi:MAG: hypothetical protein SVW77_00615, partial [Candidatus Nanohaloarchaea archaeon]|nr:hypothetical protein [Candidatus Nanohaloarchaea archaeon]